MIPLEIKLRNFLSYGPHTETIAFEPYHFICLSGKNGHGKSALLDALTWALWGQARKTSGTSKADEGLVHLGQTHMMVCLDFRCKNEHYRVRREFVKTGKKKQSLLDFGIINKNGDSYTSLSEKSIRLTQEKIHSVLGLDYNSCTNSIFLRQGQANEFSCKSPKERKEILSTILGLTTFDTLKQHAQEKVRSHHQQDKHLQNAKELLETELEKYPKLMQTYDLLCKKITQHETEEKKLSQNLQEHTAQQEKVYQDLHKKELITFQQNQLTTSYKEKSEYLQELRKQWRTLLKKIRAKNLTTHYNFSQLVQQEKQLEEAKYNREYLTTQLYTQKEYFYTLTQQLLTLYNDKLSQTHTTYQTYAYQKKQTEQEILTQDKQLSLKVEEYKEIQTLLSTLTAQLNKYKQQAFILSKKEKDFERKKIFYQRWIVKGNNLKASAQDVHQKYSFMTSAEKSECPVCLQEVKGSEKERLLTLFTSQQSYFTHQINRLKNIIPHLKQTLHTEFHNLEQLRAEQKEATRVEEKLRTNQEKIKTVKTAVQEYRTHRATLQKKLCSLQQEEKESQQAYLKLKNNKDAFLQQQEKYKSLAYKIAQLEKDINNISYDAKAHQNLKQLLLELQKEQEVSTHLTHYQQLSNEKKELIHKLCSELRSLKKQQQALAEKVEVFTALEKELTQLNTKKNELELQKQQFSQQKEELIEERGRLQQHKVILEKKQEEHEQFLIKIKKNQTVLQDYQLIAQALGKDGIQGLLIEEAIPEIEYDANNLLGKLTDNQAQIFIESTRDLKSGGTKETLDIKISDALGIRPYELFSGGEAFRIDFSLRIAISKLLARRSGTSLQTLIIDEGFGSQDEEGLHHITEALYKIQDDFEKIIIVSHLSSMKSQFPTHFHVSKTTQGSTISVMEQG